MNQLFDVPIYYCRPFYRIWYIKHAIATWSKKLIRDAIIGMINGYKPNHYTFYEYENGKDFIDRFPKQNYLPALVFMDIKMPEMNGYDTTAWIKKRHPTVPVLVLSFIVDTDSVVLAVKCGADGHIGKNEVKGPQTMNNIMERMMGGEIYFNDLHLYHFTKKRLALPKKELYEGIDSLTETEMEVLRYISLDKTYEVKASTQHISHSGYKKRLGKVFKKLNVSNTGALYRLASTLGIVF